MMLTYLGQDPHVRCRPHHDHEAAADQGLVVGDDHADRHRAPSLAGMSLARRSVVRRVARTRDPAAVTD
jgi:hypothetical protein